MNNFYSKHQDHAKQPYFLLEQQINANQPYLRRANRQPTSTYLHISTSTKNASSDVIRIRPKLIDPKQENQKLKASKKARIAYWVESGGGVDGEQGDLVDLGAEEGELPGGSEVEAAVAGGELCVAGEEGVVSREDHPEGEAIPALDPCVAARLVDAVRVRRRQLREAAGDYGER